MNKRTKQLFKEAYSHFGHGKYFTQELLAEKFAELIVRECANLVVDNDNAFDILKHFGVEE